MIQSYLLTDLKPYTMYVIAVAVRNNATEVKNLGPYSSKFRAKTEEGGGYQLSQDEFM